MTIEPWRATSVQTRSNIGVKAPDRAGAWDIINANIDHVAGLIDAATRSDAPPKLVVLPEFAMQGPPHGMAAADWIERACCTIPGPITAPLQRLARERRSTSPAINSKRPGMAGPLLQLMLPDRPAGDGHSALPAHQHGGVPFATRFHGRLLREIQRRPRCFPVVETPLGRLAMIPCGEINVPEVARVLMMQGAEVILHPTNSPRRPAQEAAKIVRAAENMVYLISANVAGPIGFSHDKSVHGGRSHILDHLGRTLAYEDGAHETQAVSALIDIEALRNGAAAGYRPSQSAAAGALGNVSAVLQQRIVLPAEQLSRCPDGRSGSRQAGNRSVAAKHGEGRRHRRRAALSGPRTHRGGVSNDQRRRKRTALTASAAIRRWATSCGSSGFRPACRPSSRPTASRCA